MPEIDPEHFVIIGGGFSGIMTAVNVARLSKRPSRVTVVNHGRPTGRGVAYGKRRPEHVLNVAARNMAAFPDEPDHFLQWLRTRSEYDSVSETELRERFISRMVYGDYLRSIMQHHLQSTGGMTPVTASFVLSEAVDIEPHENRAIVHLADGSTLQAHRVVLATGNEAPGALPGAETLAEHPAWVADPWQDWERRLPDPNGNIVVLGTGLTAVDVIISLRALGWVGGIQAISRHGWFPLSHFRGIEYPDFPPPGVDVAELGLEKLAALVRQHCSILYERNANPAIIVDKLRPYTQRIWSQFTREERLAFIQKHAARWNIFRHRIAPEIHAQITSSQLTGQLQIHAAGIERLETCGDQVLVRMNGGKSEAGRLVINATGPTTRITASQSALLQNLLQRGLAAPDDAELGLRVASDHIVFARNGEKSPFLLALGPLLRGTLWETVAVPELRGQARRVAETLLNRPSADFEPAVVVEYMI